MNQPASISCIFFVSILRNCLKHLTCLFCASIKQSGKLFNARLHQVSAAWSDVRETKKHIFLEHAGIVITKEMLFFRHRDVSPLPWFRAGNLPCIIYNNAWLDAPEQRRNMWFSMTPGE
jgi:hypothetical protein